MIIRKSYFWAIMVLGMLSASPASASINIFACEPEWGALAEEIGGDHVTVSVATTARQNAHHVSAKPSLLAKVRKADLVFCTGASLEIGWLPLLLRKAGGPDVQPETAGWLMASDYVDKLDVPDHVNRSMGHIHPEGNPHVHLNPHHILTVSEYLADRLAVIDPDHAADYGARLTAFQQRWTQTMEQWERNAGELKGAHVIVYHNGWSYLLDWLGMNAAAALEPKPGIPPTASHLEEVLRTVKAQNVQAILVAPHEDEKAAQWLSDQSGIPILHLPYTVGGNDKAQDLNGLFTETVRLLKGARS
ncbi:MAG: zinc ABC transporter substrate-binding protein [Rhodospirillales bacterium]|nr:zinc ABC transporter substrate-binding protein [Rhodospirillales bacterium]